MRIAVYHNLPSGGARRAMFELVKGLAERGHHIDEFCPQTADQTFLPLASYVQQTTVLPFRPTGVWPGRLPFLTPYINAARLTRDLMTLIRLERALAPRLSQAGYDLVFTHDCQLILNPNLLRFLSLPSMHYCHHGGRYLWPFPPADESRHGRLFKVKAAYYALPKWFYPWLRNRQSINNLRHAKICLCNSFFARESLLSACGQDSKVCYLGVDVETFRPLSLERESFVLSVGAVHYHKGYRFLISVLGCIPARQRPSLVIAANSIEPEELHLLESLACQLQVKLEVCRVTDDHELAHLYNRAAAFVYTPVLEPWGLAMVEAMACGTPVIGVREGGVRESVVDGVTGLLVERDPEEFAQVIGQLLQRQPYARELGQAAAARVRATMTWERTIDQLEQVLQAAVERKDDVSP